MARKLLNAATTAVKPKLAGRESQPSNGGDGTEAGSITTAIHIGKPTWNLLRAVAFHRAQRDGGRASVSKLVGELVEQHRPELEREMQK